MYLSIKHRFINIPRENTGKICDFELDQESIDTKA